jgi:hypothetical protein
MATLAPSSSSFRDGSSYSHLSDELAAIESRLSSLDHFLALKCTPSAASAPSGAGADPTGSLLEELSSACLPSTFHHLSERSRGLRLQVDSAHDIAEKVSGAVRRLDGLQATVTATMELAEEVMDLRRCAEGVQVCLGKGDLPGATAWVQKYQTLHSEALEGLPELQQMRSAASALSGTVLDQFEGAVQGGGVDRMQRCLPLLGPLGLASRAVESYLSFVRRLLDEQLVAAVEDCVGQPRAHQLSALYNATAAFVQQHLPLAARGLVDCDGDVHLIKEARKHCMAAASDVVDATLDAGVRSMVRKVTALVEAAQAEAQGGGAFDLFSRSSKALHAADAALDELAILLQHTESFDRFIHQALDEVAQLDRRAAEGAGLFEVERAPADELVAEASALYATLELQLLKAGVAKALSIDEIVPGSGGDGGPRVSSCVEDAFFVAQRCARRALATGHSGTASAVLNHASNALSGQLLVALTASISSAISRLPVGAGSLDLVVKQLGQLDFSDLSSLRDQVQDNLQGVGQGIASDLTQLGSQIQAQQSLGGGGGGASSDAPSSMCLVYINDLESCEEYAVRLKEELSAEVAENFQPGRGTDLLLSCLADMSLVADAFREARTLSLEDVLARLRPVLRSMVSSAMGPPDKPGAVRYALSETQFALNDASDPWAHQFVHSLDVLFAPYAHPVRGLGPASFRALLGLAASYVAERLEMSLRKRHFTQLGGLQLDKDLRSVMGFFADRGGFELRGIFARLQQIAALLNLDALAEVSDYWTVRGGALRRCLAADDVKAVLRLRDDFDPRAIQKLDLR